MALKVSDTVNKNYIIYNLNKKKFVGINSNMQEIFADCVVQLI